RCHAVSPFCTITNDKFTTKITKATKPGEFETRHYVFLPPCRRITSSFVVKSVAQCRTSPRPASPSSILPPRPSGFALVGGSRATALGRSRKAVPSSLETRRKNYRPGGALRKQDSSIPSTRLNKTPLTAQGFAPGHKGRVRAAVRRACSFHPFGKRDARNGYNGSPQFGRF